MDKMVVINVMSIVALMLFAYSITMFYECRKGVYAVGVKIAAITYVVVCIYTALAVSWGMWGVALCWILYIRFAFNLPSEVSHFLVQPSRHVAAG